jgi:hypothetical protein
MEKVESAGATVDRRYVSAALDAVTAADQVVG